MIRRSRFIEQWIPHDGTVWKVWLVRTLIMRLMFVPADYVVTRDSKAVYVCPSLSESRDYIREAMVADEVQVPFHLLPTVSQRFVQDAERTNKVYFGWSTLNDAGVLDLIRFGWIRFNDGGNFRRIPAK